MRPLPAARRHAERGFIMIASLLLLVVVTILALGMFRSFGVQEKISGNLREKNRARLAADSALQYAEWWLSSGSNSATATTCTTQLNANTNQGQVCTNALSAVVANVAMVPWAANGAPVGVTYTPPSMTINTSPGVNTYYAAPAFYISLVGGSADGQGTIYRITSMGYGGTSDSVAVIESTYEVGTGTKDLGAL